MQHRRVFGHSTQVLAETLHSAVYLSAAAVGLAVTRHVLDLVLHPVAAIFAPNGIIIMHAVHFCVATFTQHLFIYV